MIVRPESSEDVPHIFKIHSKAFNTDDEAYLIDALRHKKVPMISLVAEEDKTLIGHIVFTPMIFTEKTTKIAMAGLGPMAVLPTWQNKGVGSKLIVEGLAQCLTAGYQAVSVLGHKDYYPRFGFVPSTKYDIKSSYNIPEDIFMIKELKKDSLKNVKGTIYYNELFRDAP